MVEEQLAARGIRDPRILETFRSVPRHPFVPVPYRPLSHADQPLPIGRGQTISQPYVVALMLQCLELRGKEKVLEVGSGSGYVLALLSRLCGSARGVELEPELCDRSRQTLAQLQFHDIRIRCGDGFEGWPEEGPFDAILLSCAAPSLPAPLVDQLKEGGRIVAPVGTSNQDLMVYTKRRSGLIERRIVPVRFVRMRSERFPAR